MAILCPQEGSLMGPCHLLSLVSFHRLSCLLFSFLLVHGFPLRLPKKSLSSYPFFGSRIVLLSPPKQPFHTYKPSRSFSKSQFMRIVSLASSPGWPAAAVDSVRASSTGVSLHLWETPRNPSVCPQRIKTAT